MSIGDDSWDLENEDPIEYFRRVLTEVICDTSSKSYELGVPKYFSSDSTPVLFFKFPISVTIPISLTNPYSNISIS